MEKKTTSSTCPRVVGKARDSSRVFDPVPISASCAPSSDYITPVTVNLYELQSRKSLSSTFIDISSISPESLNTYFFLRTYFRWTVASSLQLSVCLPLKVDIDAIDTCFFFLSFFSHENCFALRTGLLLVVRDILENSFIREARFPAHNGQRRRGRRRRRLQTTAGVVVADPPSMFALL